MDKLGSQWRAPSSQLDVRFAKTREASRCRLRRETVQPVELARLTSPIYLARPDLGSADIFEDILGGFQSPRQLELVMLH